MKHIWREIEALRGSIDPQRLAGVLLREVAEINGEVPELHSGLERDWQEFRESPSYPHLQSAARLFLELSEAERIESLPLHINIDGRSHFGYGFIEGIPAKKIAEMAGPVASVRCSFGPSAMPALQIALEAKIARRPLHVRFIDLDIDLCDLVKLAAAAIGVSIDVIAGQPFSRIDGGSFEAEICMPPFGANIRDREELPRKTLERIDAAERGRLHFEPVAMADMLVHAPNARVVFSFTAGALFRTVGFEAVARSEIIDSGRLVAVFAVPPNMIYTTTQIATGIVVLKPKGHHEESIRFVDLADKRFATKANRGRYNIDRRTSWAEAIDCEISDDVLWARDVAVSEIHDQSDVLSAERYLRTQSGEALSVFLANYETRPLGDVVEVIRPAAIPKSEDGEFIIHEASPGDIGEEGFLNCPPKETRVARGALRKARNQQVRPGDVLLSVKGTIGKTGMIPKNVPGSDEDSFWTAGQSLVILRSKGSISPEVLFEYLSNSLVQDYIGSLAGGAAIQSITAKDLAALQIPVPSKEQQAQVGEEFQKRQHAFEKLHEIRQTIDHIKNQSWPHAELKMTEVNP